MKPFHQPFFFWAFILIAADQPTISAFNSFLEAKVKPVHASIHFAKSTEVWLKTGEAVINFELPVQATACLGINFNKAVHATHPITTPFGEELRLADWGKLRDMDNVTEELKDNLEIMGFKEQILKICDEPQYQVILDVDPEVRQARKPTPPEPRTPKVDPNCQALRIGASCSVYPRRRRRSVGHRPRRAKRDLTNRDGRFSIRNAAARKLGKMAAATIEKHLAKVPVEDPPKLDQWEIFVSAAEKIIRGISGMHVGSVLSAGGDIAGILGYFKCSARLNKLTEHVTEINTRVGKLAESMVKVLNTLEEEKLGHMYQDILDYIRRFNQELDRIIVAITQGYFPKDMFEMPAFKTAVEALELEASQKGDTLLDKSPMAALQSPMGWSFEDTGNLNVYLRLDVTRESLRMVLYQIFFTPFMTSNGPMVIDTEIRFLATTVTPSNTFLVMTMDQYKTCRNVAGKLMCPDARVVHKKDNMVPGFNDAMCIHAAFIADNEGILRFCTFTRPIREETLQSVSDNEFLGYSNRSLTIMVHCQNSQISTHLESPPGTFILEMPDGCKADSPAHTVWNVYLLSSQSIFLQRRWRTPHALTNIVSLPPSDIEFLVDTRKTLANLQAKHQTTTRQLEETQREWMGPGTIVFASLFAAVLAIAAIYCSCKNKKAIGELIQCVRNQEQQRVTPDKNSSSGPTATPRTVNRLDFHQQEHE